MLTPFSVRKLIEVSELACTHNARVYTYLPNILERSCGFYASKGMECFIIGILSFLLHSY